MLSVQSSPPKSNTVQEIEFNDRKVDATHDNWAKTPSGSDRSTAVGSICRLTRPSSQIRPPVTLRIEDQAQIFDLGTQRESVPAYARKGEIRNFIIF